MRRILLVGMTLSAVLLAAGATAWACTNLATMNLSANQVQAGDSVHITGSSYKLPETGGQEIVVRWDSLDGEVLATTMADTTGNIDVTITVPTDAEPGNHVLVATQDVERDNGELVAAHGTPTRASLTVGQPAADVVRPPAAQIPTAAAVAGPNSGLIVLGGLLGLAGIGLFAAGATLFVREAQQQRPVPAPVERK